LDLKRSLQPRPAILSFRLIILAVVFVAAFSLFAWLRWMESAPLEAEPADAGVIPMEAVEGIAPPGATIDHDLLAEVRDATESERVIREPQPFLHLLFEAGKLVAGDFRRMKAPFVDDALHERILAAPDAWRGRPLVAKARFSFATEERIPLAEGGEQFRFWRGVAGDDLGRTWSFSVLEPPGDLAPGDVIRIEGFFFKKLALFDPVDSRQLIDPTLHLIGKRVVKSFLHMPSVRELSPAILSTLRDYEIQDRLDLPDEPLWHVLSYVDNTDADVLAAAAEESVNRESGEALYVTSAALLKDPDRYRGEAVRLLGSMSRDQPPWPKDLGPDGENPLDIPVVWHSLLVHQGPTFTYLISKERPPGWTRGNPTVIVEGIFFKLFTYQAKNRQTVTCPLVVVKRFVPFTIESEALRSGISWALIGLSVPLVGGLLFWAMRDRKAAEELRHRRSARRRGHRPGEAPTG